MSALFQPTGEKEFFTPFGPLVGYFRMSDELVGQLNDAMSEALADHSRRLVGKVRQELSFSKELVDLAGRGLGNVLTEYHIRGSRRGTFGDYDHTTRKYALNIISAWFVRQFENEYNPLHIHKGCTLSCVGYLALPDGIEEEWAHEEKPFYPSHGHLQFAHGTDTHYSVSNFLVRPRVGDFYMFPSYMFHCVYPFKTAGERRSFSMNLSVDEMPV